MTATSPTPSPVEAIHLVAVHLLPTPLGRRWQATLEPHRAELAQHYGDRDLQHRINTATIALAVLATSPKASSRTVEPALADAIAEILDSFTHHASPALQHAITGLRDEARHAAGRPLADVLDR